MLKLSYDLFGMAFNTQYRGDIFILFYLTFLSFIFLYIIVVVLFVFNCYFVFW